MMTFNFLKVSFPKTVENTSFKGAMTVMTIIILTLVKKYIKYIEYSI